MDEDDDCHDDDVEQSHQGLEPQAIGLGRFLPAKRCIVRSPGLWRTARYFSWATWGSTIIGFYIIVITQRWLFDDMGLYDYRFYIIVFTQCWLFDDRGLYDYRFYIIVITQRWLFDDRPYVRKITNDRQIMFDCDKVKSIWKKYLSWFTFPSLPTFW